MSRPIDMTAAKTRLNVYAQLLHAAGIEVAFPEGGGSEINILGRTFVNDVPGACAAMEEAVGHIPESPADIWGEDEEWTRDDWKVFVANNETNLGYWEWVKNAREMDAL